VENLSFLTSFWLAAKQSDPAFQTRADITFYGGTLFGLLMTPAKKYKETTTDYEERIVRPLLEIVKNIAQRQGDNRADVRHNIIVSVWLACQGPHKDLIQAWIKENKYLLHANGVYGSLKFDERRLKLPQDLREKALIKALFREWMWNSDNSTDGIIVKPLSKK
jgi:hypothetical protein